MKVLVGTTFYASSTSKESTDVHCAWDYTSTPSGQREKGDGEQH